MAAIVFSALAASMWSLGVFGHSPAASVVTESSESSQEAGNSADATRADSSSLPLIPTSSSVATLEPTSNTQTGVKALSLVSAQARGLRSIVIDAAVDLTSPLFVSVRQSDKSWRIAVALPGQHELQYVEALGSALQPAPSPDGQYLAFVSDESGTDAVYLLNVHTNQVQQISSPDLAAQLPAWSPDARYVVYTGEPRGGRDVDSRNHVFDTATGQTRKLNDVHGGWATWSSANEIVFTSWTGRSFDLFRINPDGSGLTNLTSTDDLDEDIPAWSPDGSRIAFVRNPRNKLDQRQVYTIYRDGTDIRQLTTSHGPNSNPVWAVDGTTIAYAHQPAPDTWQPWLITSTGEQDRPLGQNNDRVWFMNWGKP